MATATTTTRPGYRIAVARTFAGGSLRFEPVPASVKVTRSKDLAVRTARKELPSGVSAPTPEVFFAQYLLETSERVVSGVPKPNKEYRTVWVVRFPRVDGERKSGVILRSNIPTVVPVTTVPKRVLTDVLVVVDDASGRVLLRSEFSPEQPEATRP